MSSAESEALEPEEEQKLPTKRLPTVLSHELTDAYGLIKFYLNSKQGLERPGLWRVGTVQVLSREAV